MKTRKILTAKETRGIWDYLTGIKSSRQVAKDIGGSHQRVINLVATICREWVQDKEIGIIGKKLRELIREEKLSEVKVGKIKR